MDRFEAARHLGLADTEVVTVTDTADGTAVRVKDGSERLVTDEGVFALNDHPATANFRRWDGSDAPAEALAEAREAAAPNEQPTAGESTEDRDGKGGEVPDGNADAVLDWVGEDRDRAARALEVEVEREHPRSTLVSKLRKLAES
ncbi:hypothetical protein GCM10023196_035640 [Actinoallomurus vinaceus]|uniref:Uncharacterized protein n=1 Tax=Actinoallomurus vinaceus TaxID=1080074 RepID=A0ABP8UAD0_9ACTN